MVVKFSLHNHLYDRSDDICFEFGFDVKLAVKMFIKSTVLINAIPFDIDPDVLKEAVVISNDTSLGRKTLSLDIHDGTYRSFIRICERYGLLPNTFVTVFLVKTVFENAIPLTFSISEANVKKMAKDTVARMYAKKIDAALSRFPESERDEMRSKMINDISDIRETTTFTPVEYFELRLYEMPREQWLDEYLCDKDMYEVMRRLNGSVGFNTADKYAVYEYFKDYYHRDVTVLKTDKDVVRVNLFFRKHDKLLAKPLHGSLSAGIKVITKKEFENDHNILLSMLDYSPEGVMLEEIIEQNEVLKSLNPPSLNTFRMLTLRDIDDNVKVYGVLRVGTTDSISDGVNLGGITCKVDWTTGEVLDARDTAGVSYVNNPGCGNKIVGVKIPDFQGAIDLVTMLAKKIPEYRYIGWDIALSKKGWTLIEFNGKSSVVALEAMEHGFKKEFEELFRQLGKPVELIRPKYRYFT